MTTFPTNISFTVKKWQICISFASNNYLRKQCLCYLLCYKWWKPCLLISKPVFRWFLLNYTDFANKISYTNPSKYDSTSGTKISICLNKVGGWGCGSEQAPLRRKKNALAVSQAIPENRCFFSRPVYSCFLFNRDMNKRLQDERDEYLAKQRVSLYWNLETVM